MENLPFLIAFTLGLVSTLHCLGMCGGIISALSLSIKKPDAAKSSTLFFRILGYNLGRIFSYCVAGIFAGLLGMLFLESINQTLGYKILQSFASLFLVLLGLHIAGWFPALRKIEYLGVRLWSFLQPVGKLFLPIDSLYKSLIVGAIWGWLPCGLVYSVLIWTVTSADPILGGVYMLAFGLGTLPGMVAAGLVSNHLTRFFTKRYIRQVMGLLLISFALSSFFLTSHGHHHTSHEKTEKHQHHH